MVGSFGNQASATEGTGQRNQLLKPTPGWQTVAGVSGGFRSCCDLRGGWALAVDAAMAKSIGGRHAKGQGQHQDRCQQDRPGAEGVGPPLGVEKIGPRAATPAAAEGALHLGNQVFTAVGAGHPTITQENEKPGEAGDIQLFKANKKRPPEAGAWRPRQRAYLAEAKSG